MSLLISLRNENTLSQLSGVQWISLILAGSQDRFGNPAGQGVDGQVEVRVELCPGDGDKDLPVLEAQSDPLYLQLTEGTAHVSVSSPAPLPRLI